MEATPGDRLLSTDTRRIDDVVDTTRYPLAQPGSEPWRAAVTAVRDDLAVDGCSVLAGFVRPDAVESLRREGEQVAPLAYDAVEVVNAYNLDAEVAAGLPEGHPGRLAFERGNAFVPWDRIPAHLAVHRLYASPLVQGFVAACVGLPEVHPLADPLAGLTVNVVRPGREHPWHFDTNEFSVSLLTQQAESGGDFEYAPGIRSPGAENLDDVRGVLAGTRPDLVHRLVLRPGDLQVFLGRFSLHRVTPVAGGRERHSAILAYSERPGVVGSVARTRQLFGRALPQHVAMAGPAGRVRGDTLLD